MLFTQKLFTQLFQKFGKGFDFQTVKKPAFRVLELRFLGKQNFMFTLKYRVVLDRCTFSQAVNLLKANLITFVRVA